MHSWNLNWISRNNLTLCKHTSCKRDMSDNLSFIYDHPIICKTIKYINQFGQQLTGCVCFFNNTIRFGRVNVDWLVENKRLGLGYISAILWRSVLLVEETGVPGENHRPAASHWQTWSYNVVSSTPCLSGIRTDNFSGDRNWNPTTIRSRPQRPSVNMNPDMIL